jgi:3-oxoadipate enol-lactonase
VESLALLEPALIAGSTADSYRTSLVRGIERFHEIDAAVLAHEFLQARWPNYRDALEAVVPGAFAQAVADAATVFEVEVPALVEWRFGEAEARRIKQPLLSVLGGDSDALWARFGEVHHLLLSWMPQAEGFVVPDATHFMQLQEPRLLAERLADFVRRGG